MGGFQFFPGCQYLFVDLPALVEKQGDQAHQHERDRVDTAGKCGNGVPGVGMGN